MNEDKRDKHSTIIKPTDKKSVISAASENIQKQNSKTLKIDAENNYQRGLDYFYGRVETKINSKKARNAFLLAHQAGHTLASAYLVGLDYKQTEINQTSREQIIRSILPKLSDLANRQQNAEAQYQLGFLYLQGEVVSKEVEKAKKLFEQAIAHGHASAMFGLGVMYLRGDIGKNLLEKERYGKAGALLKKSMKQGNVYIHHRIIHIYI